MKQKLKNIGAILGRLSSKEIIEVILILVLGLWMMLSLNFDFKITFNPWGGYIRIGSKAINATVDLENKTIEVGKKQLSNSAVNKVPIETIKKSRGGN